MSRSESPVGAPGGEHGPLPAEEVHVLGMFDDAAAHHDGLEVQPIDGPQLDVRQR